MKYTDQQRIQKIYDYSFKLLGYIKEKNIEKEELLNDFSLQWLVTTPLYNIGEHVYFLSDGYKSKHSDIPWTMISGLRHRLIHDYDGTNWSIIADVVFDELPALLKRLEDLI